MVNKVFTALSLLLMLVPTALSGQANEVRSLQHFNRVSVDDAIIVRLVKSDHETATIKAEGVGMDAIKTEVENGTLKIYVYGHPFTEKKVTVNLEFVDLLSIQGINGADITTTSLFRGENLDVELKTGALLYLDLDISYLKSNVIEGSVLTAEGYATTQDIYVASLATVSLYELESEKINVRAVTGGNAKIAVEAELNAEALTRGYISVKGNPPVNKMESRSGGSIVSYEE